MTTTTYRDTGFEAPRWLDAIRIAGQDAVSRQDRPAVSALAPHPPRRRGG